MRQEYVFLIGEMAKQIKMLFAETDDLISIPGTHKERMDSKLSSDLHTHVLGCVEVPQTTKFNIFFLKLV